MYVCLFSMTDPTIGLERLRFWIRGNWPGSNIGWRFRLLKSYIYLKNV